MTKSKVFITGANGFIGKHVCAKLDKMGIDFLAMVQSAEKATLSKKRIVELSLQDKTGLEQTLRNYQPDAILHLAAVASPTFGDIMKIYEVNVKGSENLLEAAKNVCKSGTRVILASTAGVYGNQKIDLLHEKLCFDPVNHYSYSKMVMEFLSQHYREELDIGIVRPFNMIGNGQQDNFLVPKLVNNYVTRVAKLKLGNMNTARDYVDVDYAVRIFIELLLQDTLKEQVLNICTGVATEGTELLRMLSEITGYQPEIEITNEFVRKNEIWRMVGDPTKLRKIGSDIGEPKTVYQILEEMVQIYQEDKIYESI